MTKEERIKYFEEKIAKGELPAHSMPFVIKLLEDCEFDPDYTISAVEGTLMFYNYDLDLYIKDAVPEWENPNWETMSEEDKEDWEPMSEEDWIFMYIKTENWIHKFERYDILEEYGSVENYNKIVREMYPEYRNYILQYIEKLKSKKNKHG